MDCYLITSKEWLTNGRRQLVYLPRPIRRKNVLHFLSLYDVSIKSLYKLESCSGRKNKTKGNNSQTRKIIYDLTSPYHNVMAGSHVPRFLKRNIEHFQHQSQRHLTLQFNFCVIHWHSICFIDSTQRAYDEITRRMSNKSKQSDRIEEIYNQLAFK